MQKVIERILNLLAFLLTTNRPVTAEEIRMTVAGYDQGSDEAWRRMFERDKDLLRQLGIPLTLAPLDAFEVDFGYVVPREDYSLPDPGLSDEERTALWLAAQVVRIGSDAAEPAAIFKLGGAPGPATGEPLGANLGAHDDDLAEAFLAVSERRSVEFTYRDRRRTVSPYGLVHRRGHWYVVGPEKDDDNIKVFRLDRATDVRAGEQPSVFSRPAGFSAADSIPEAPWETGADDMEATVRFDADMAWWARRQITGRATVDEHDDGSITARLPVSNPDAFVGWVLAFEDRAVIESPPELRSMLVSRVRAAS